jgi:DNA polymerase III delta prime subunit
MLKTSVDEDGTKKHIPFTEKYRATDMNGVILSPVNRIILRNIVDQEKFPNILFYGPPGTGKTTTIINLIREYQERWSAIDRRAVIHLNASHDRGIETIRGQLQQFVYSRNLFSRGLKFVVLDEADYMTKNAQQVMRYLIQTYSGSVRFCLICNYLTRIDAGLRNELMLMHFNNLPPNSVTHMLTDIVDKEKMQLPLSVVQSIRHFYKSDVRSMINCLQLKHVSIGNENDKKRSTRSFHIIDDALWESLYRTPTLAKTTSITARYQCNMKSLWKQFGNYIIRNKPEMVTSEFLSFLETIMHMEHSQTSTYAQYAMLTFIRMRSKVDQNERK